MEKNTQMIGGIKYQKVTSDIGKSICLRVEEKLITIVFDCDLGLTKGNYLTIPLPPIPDTILSFDSNAIKLEPDGSK